MTRFLIWVTCLAFSSPMLGQTALWNSTSPLSRLKLNFGYGYRIHPLTGKEKFHAGIDLAARSDTVLAVMDGVVTQTGYHPLLGLYIRINHGGGLESLFGHLSQLWVVTGETLSAGSPIGLTGSTGQVTGEHLHFAVKFNNRFINPLLFLKIILRRSCFNPTHADHE
ncbi:M23 family metallopeptidase [Mucilaginibacter sp. PAMB04274]|uniref:M23 family metallopeptidase n=1 Tax=Mucilaginibacter sp. PAMB04274 TaxID=3138568 RepID=UPI0031F65A48